MQHTELNRNYQVIVRYPVCTFICLYTFTNTGVVCMTRRRHSQSFQKALDIIEMEIYECTSFRLRNVCICVLCGSLVAAYWITTKDYVFFFIITSKYFYFSLLLFSTLPFTFILREHGGMCSCTSIYPHTITTIMIIITSARNVPSDFSTIVVIMLIVLYFINTHTHSYIHAHM